MKEVKIGIFIILALFLTSTVYATEYYVSTSGSDTYSGTKERPWRHIDYAVDHVSAGDTVYVRGGVYKERVTISCDGTANNYITIKNYQNEAPIIDGEGRTDTGWWGLVDFRGATYVVFQGFEIRNYHHHRFNNGIMVAGRTFVDNGQGKYVAQDSSSHIEIRDCVVHGTGSSGIAIGMEGDYNALVEHILVDGCEIYDTNYFISQESLSIVHCNYCEISNLHMHDVHKEGLDIKGICSHISVHDSHLHHIPGAGIYLGMAGQGDKLNEHIEIYNNNIHHIQPDCFHDCERWWGYTMSSAIFFNMEGQGGTLRNIDVYNNILGYECSDGGIRFTVQPSGDPVVVSDINIYNNVINEGMAYKEYDDDRNVGPQSSLLMNQKYEPYYENVKIFNNILWGQTPDNMIKVTGGLDEFEFSHNLFQQQESSWNPHITADPKFVGGDWTKASSYRLKSDSPARNAGTSALASSTDFDGKQRDSSPDIGAFEYAGSTPPPDPVEDVYYVSTNGNDNNPGTKERPWKTINKAANTLKAGDTAYIRGGTYYPTSAIRFRTSGTESKPITFSGYQNERVIIDGSNAPKDQVDGKGLLMVMAQWLVFENFEVTKSKSQGIRLHAGWSAVDSNNNIIRNVKSYYNEGSGIMCTGYSNQFLDIVAHHNSDVNDPRFEGENADGISLDSGGKNIVRNCVLYENSDDGIDTWTSTGNIIEDCIAYGNHGYGPRGDGVGFKLGKKGGNTVRRCIAYNNRYGFGNNGGVNNIIDHCTAYNNDKYPFAHEYYWTDNLNTPETNTYSNNIGDSRIYNTHPEKLIQHNNNWNLEITDPKFKSTDPNSPDFLRLREDSPCRGAASDGSDIGAFQYTGSEPQPEFQPEDINQDNKIDILDLIMIGQRMGHTGSNGWIREDVIKDGKIDILDMISVAQHQSI
ncbi:MAG: hypothetical protein GY861_16230 [bacterium]|nr:hypothetical protein [bacterium]